MVGPLFLWKKFNLLLGLKNYNLKLKHSLHLVQTVKTTMLGVGLLKRTIQMAIEIEVAVKGRADQIL